MDTMVGLSPFRPLDAVVPFTYRDNASYLEILEDLREFVNNLTDLVNANFGQSGTDLNTAVANLTTEINSAIDTLNAADTQVRTDLNATITTQIANVNSAVDAVNQRVTDAWATSNTGLDERVTAAESKVDTYMQNVNAGPGRNAPQQTATELLASLADTQKGSVTIAVASDSTANDPTDWVRIWSQIYGPLLTDPSLRREYKVWNDTTQAWNASIVDQAGVAVPGSGGTIVADSFSRTGELVGSVPNTGPAWLGKAGTWSADGNYAKQTGSTTGVLAVNCVDGFGSPIRNVSISAYFSLVTAASAAAQQMRLQVASPIMTSDSSGLTGGVYVTLAVSASGAVTGGLYKLINGTNTQLALFGTIPGIVAASSTAQKLTLSVALNNDLTCSATIQLDGQAAATITGAITESDWAWLGGYSGLVASTLASPGYSVDSINISSPTNPVPPQPGLFIANGAVPGSTILYQKTRIATMWPTKPDILLISTGHNDVKFSPTDFLANIDSFLAACSAQWGSLPKILISSQNREKDPSVNKDFHARRQAAFRQYAMSKGYQYLPEYELSLTLADSTITADGVHPTTPAAWPLTAGDTTVYGSVEWAKLMQNFVTSRMFRTS